MDPADEAEWALSLLHDALEHRGRSGLSWDAVTTALFVLFHPRADRAEEVFEELRSTGALQPYSGTEGTTRFYAPGVGYQPFTEDYLAKRKDLLEFLSDTGSAVMSAVSRRVGRGSVLDRLIHDLEREEVLVRRRSGQTTVLVLKED
jgi:hypothetical protein